jgi:hypothetical protein
MEAKTMSIAYYNGSFGDAAINSETFFGLGENG